MTSSNKVNILIVDDLPANLLSLEAVLEVLGENLVRASSGAEALEFIGEQDFAAILLDVQMPGLSGFETAKLIRSHDRSQITPIIFITAAEDKQFSVRDAYALGAVDYLTTPIVPEFLRAKVGFFAQLYRETAALRNAERKAAASALQAKDERLNLMMENIRDHAVVITDIDGFIVEWLAGAERITGFQESDAVGKKLDIIFTSEDVAAGRPDEEFTKAKHDGRSDDVRWHLRKDGTRFFADGVVTALNDDSGTLRGFAKVFRDATVQFEAEAARRQHIERLRTMAHVSTRLNTVLDLPSVLSVVNEEGRNLIGAHQAVTSVIRQAAEPIQSVSLSIEARGGDTLVTIPDRAAVHQAVRRGIKAVRLNQAELKSHESWAKFQAAAEAPPPLSGWLAAPLLGRTGEEIGLIQLSNKAVGEFNEEDEALVVQLAQMASVAVENVRLFEELREADHAKDQFLAMLAHELRNPLAPIRNAVSVLHKTGPSSDQIASRLWEILNRQIAQLTRLVDDLLDVSRITTGRVELRREPVELSQLVSKAIETSSPNIEAREHVLSVDVSEEPLWLDADPVRMTQVLSNLLNNAAKYTRAGGRIRLLATRDEGGVVIRVIDNGIGISKEMLARVFDLFTQASTDIDRTAGGLGIGLTLVRKLVGLHGGTVTALSEGVGKGSEFVVRLPMIPPPVVTPSVELPRIPPSRAKRVLVVDDNSDVRESMAILITIYGHVVQTAADGFRAVELARTFQPELMFLDIGLPDRDGYEVARILRKEFPKGKLYLVAVTGYGQYDDRERTRDAGFDLHLTKPVDPDALTKALQGS